MYGVMRVRLSEEKQIHESNVRRHHLNCTCMLVLHVRALSQSLLWLHRGMQQDIHRISTCPTCRVSTLEARVQKPKRGSGVSDALLCGKTKSTLPLVTSCPLHAPLYVQYTDEMRKFKSLGIALCESSMAEAYIVSIGIRTIHHTPTTE